MDNQQDNEKLSPEERASIRDQLLELELRLEKEWMTKLAAEHQRAVDELTDIYEKRAQIDKAHARIATAFLSVLHTKGKKIPSVIGANNEVDENALNVLVAEASNIAILGSDFEVIVGAIHSNPLVTSEWDRFCSFLRMAE